MRTALRRIHQALLAYFCAGLTAGVLCALFWQLRGLDTPLSLSSPGPLSLALVWFASAAYFLACLTLSAHFRERFVARLAGFRERDEREQLVTANAARSTFLVTLATFLALGLAGAVRINAFGYAKYEGLAPKLQRDARPDDSRRWPLVRPIERRFMFWPSLWLPIDEDGKGFEDGVKDAGHTEFFIARHSLVPPSFARAMLICALLQVLVFHWFARRQAAR